MARRVSLPAADDLFRPTAEPEAPATGRHGEEAPGETSAVPAPAPPASQQTRETRETSGGAPGERAGSRGQGSGSRRPSGRVRHDEKMTVYVTSDELLVLEHARLLLRREHGLAVDRGRLVREAVALALADLDARGEESVIVQRLKQV